MSIAEQIIPYAQKQPFAEIVDVAKGNMWADVREFEGVYGAPKGDALTALCTTAYCREQPFERLDIELHRMVRNTGKILNLIAPIDWHRSEYRPDTVIICHGPLAERGGGLPKIGLDNHYPGWLNTVDNDGEVTLVSTLPKEVLEKSIRLGIKKFQKWDAYKRGSTWNTKIKSTDWIEPPWNVNGSSPNINRYMRTSYTYWKRSEFPALDFHTISGSDALDQFLTIYGDIYSNIFGSRFLACLIKPDGSLEQRIWQPIKPERAPKHFYISFTRPNEILKMPWIIPETVRLARETVRSSIVTDKVAQIDPALIEPIKTALQSQSKTIRESLGQEWLDKYPGNRYKTTLYRANLLAGDLGIEKVNHELKKVGWFEATGVNPCSH